MDVAGYRKFNKPGWVLKRAWDDVYVAIGNTTAFTELIEQAHAYDDIDEAQRAGILTTKLGYASRVIPIPDLPKKNAEEEIKNGLEKVVGDIVEYQTVSLNYLGIASNLYDLIVRIVEEKTKK